MTWMKTYFKTISQFRKLSLLLSFLSFLLITILTCTELSDSSSQAPRDLFLRVFLQTKLNCEKSSNSQFEKVCYFYLVYLSKSLLSDLFRERINIISIYEVTFWSLFFWWIYSGEIKEDKVWLPGWNCRYFWKLIEAN